MLTRHKDTDEVEDLLGDFPVVAILGARQVGKTTLARSVAEGVAEVTWFDLEDPRSRARLADPVLALEGLKGLVVIDEVHNAPELFPWLRVLADRPHRPAQFLILGSAAPELLRQGGETLAGRIAFHRLRGFALDEVGVEAADTLWLRGGFPPSFLARSDRASARWREHFVDAFLGRDLADLGVSIPPETMRRFWTMLAHYHGQTWNGSELARAFGISHHTARRYLDLLAATFVVRVLQPWHENVSKRQVKSPKVYLADSGLLHTMLGLPDRQALEGHPKVGASFEGFALEQVVRRLGAQPHECHFWATQSGAELDLLVVRGEERRAFEFKRTSTPRRTRSMLSAMETLSLDAIDVVHPGRDVFSIAENVRGVGIERVLDAIEPLHDRSHPSGHFGLTR